jgi:hypothetical protein
MSTDENLSDTFLFPEWSEAKRSSLIIAFELHFRIYY